MRAPAWQKTSRRTDPERATLHPGRRLAPLDALRLFYGMPGSIDNKVIAFANLLANHYTSPAPETSVRVPLYDLRLPALAYGSLRRAGYQWMDEVDALSDHDILLIKNIGPVMLSRIRRAIARHKKSRE